MGTEISGWAIMERQLGSAVAFIPTTHMCNDTLLDTKWAKPHESAHATHIFSLEHSY